ncbi:MAG: extracellular solute-binding protein, partial [Chthonomonadales bacterium]
ADTALIINKTMLKEAGLDPNRAPKTVEELDHYCDLITKRMPDGRLERVGFIPSEPGWWNWAWGGMFGGKVWDGGTKIRANSKENVRAFTWIQSFAKKYGGSNIQAFKSGLGKFSAPENGFFSNKVAMEIQGNWMFNFIKKYAPQMEHPTRTWMVAPTPYPADRPDLVNNTIVDLDIIGIPRGAKHPKEAFEFIKFLQSVKGMEMLCLKHGKHTPLMKTSLGYFETHPNPDVRLFADLAQGKATVSPPKLGIWPEYKDALGAAFDEVILDKRSPQEALNAVQDRMQAKLDQYLKRKRLRGELR